MTQCLRPECVRRLNAALDTRARTAARRRDARDVAAAAYEDLVRGLPYPSAVTVADAVVAALIKARLLPVPTKPDDAS